MTMTAAAGAAVSFPFPGLAALEKQLDPRFLSLEDRQRIADLHAHGKSLRKIAEELGRAASTISRELARNSVSGGGYYAYAAQPAATARRPQPKDRKLLADSRLRQHVKNRLHRRWSPEQISRKLVKKFPNDPELCVSPETIYQALYLQAAAGSNAKYRPPCAPAGPPQTPQRPAAAPVTVR
ncbi:transposase [Arthrobacter sp. NPDC058130]|uniref:transposase n=1 Tax=Arthrobacter sp. NPDC058130 TaxID=3346353 RepID=UPI0036F044C4